MSNQYYEHPTKWFKTIYFSQKLQIHYLQLYPQEHIFDNLVPKLRKSQKSIHKNSTQFEKPSSQTKKNPKINGCKLDIWVFVM
jgi:hypothetical protein